MEGLAAVSNAELIARMPKLVKAERALIAQVIEHLMEIDRRKLYLEQACSSLFSYCTDRLGYSEDEALKRVRVARLARQHPQVLAELRSGSMHLTGLFLLSQHQAEPTFTALLSEARGKSRREIECMLALRFPRPDLPPRIRPLGSASTCLGPGTAREAPNLIDSTGSADVRLKQSGPSHAAPPGADSAALRYRIEFTASASLRDKIQRALELLSHSLPHGDLNDLFERALDELIRIESKHRLGSKGKSTEQPRRQRQLKPGSRHVPVAIAHRVWERDGGRCTWVDAEGRRCSERRFLTLEHHQPYALGGPPTLENICLLCRAHNTHNARKVFGASLIARKIQARKRHSRKQGSEPLERQNHSPNNETGREQAAHAAPSAIEPCPNVELTVRVHDALRAMGFQEREVLAALATARSDGSDFTLESLLRAALHELAIGTSAVHGFREARPRGLVTGSSRDRKDG